MKDNKISCFVLSAKKKSVLFDKFKKEINDRNLSRLKLVSLIAGIFDLLVFFTLIIVNMYFSNRLLSFSDIVFRLAGILSSFTIYFLLRSSLIKLKYSTIVCYIYYILSVIFYNSLFLTFNMGLNESIICCVYIIYALMMVDKPWRFSSIFLICNGVLCVSFLSSRPLEVSIFNCINCIIFSLVACIAHYYISYERLDRLILISRIEKQRDTDFLTKLLNKSKIELSVDEHILLNRGSYNALIVLDLDGFKNINDVYGHQQGDKVLIEMAKILRSIFRRNDEISRVGGDEFVIFLKNITETDAIIKKVNLMIEKTNQITVNKTKNLVGCSVGIVFSNKDDDYKMLFKYADEAMYEAKSDGKNQYKIYNR